MRTLRLVTRLGEQSLARQLLLLQTVIMLLVCLVVAAVVLLDTRRDLNAAAEQKVLAVAGTVARSPQVIDAVRAVAEAPETARDHTEVQRYAESVRHSSGTDFVVVMTPKRVRLSHPTPEQIGRHFIGTIGPALRGRSFTETYTGTLGPSVRAVTPVRYRGQVVGLVSVGITVEKIGQDFWRQMPAVLGVVALAYLLAVAGVFMVSRRLRRQTHGLGPREITRMYEYWDAVLHSVREGLLVLDTDRRVQLANDEALRLLELPAGSVGAPIGQAPLPESLREVAESGRDAVDELHLVGLRALLVNQRPARWEGRELGTVITFRDHTELTALLGELASVKSFAEALRSQNHEASNRLHTVIALVELGRGEAAVELATGELRLTQQLTDRVMGAVREPVLSALLLGKVSQAKERGVELVVSEDTAVRDAVIDPRDLVTLVGNLIDNAIDAALSGGPPRRVLVTACEQPGELLIRVADTGPGLDPDRLAELIRCGSSTKGDGRGLGLALVDQAVRRHGGELTLRQDGGAVFEARLPVPAATPLATPAVAGRGAPAGAGSEAAR